MQEPATPIDETQRLRSLQSLKVLDTLPEERFDRFTRLATRLFNVPIALVSLVDRDRQWFKSRQGLDATETCRSISFCGHAILEQTPLIVPDSLLDPRFADNPLVTGGPAIRFYAGHPIRASDGSSVGTLCIIDTLPREFTAEDVAMLADLASMVDRELALMSLATIDELTRLSNRRGFMEIARHLLQLCRRHAVPATLIALDLNGFKKINDTHGHAAGDRVLREFAGALLKQFRASDVVARLGGDEFCVLAGGTQAGPMTEALKRFALSFARSELARDYPGLSWSCGVAEFDPSRDTTTDELLSTADQRMYDAKGQAAASRPAATSGA
jgi:diguanylate cyclase (GGDEF)-like protein